MRITNRSINRFVKLCVASTLVLAGCNAPDKDASQLTSVDSSARAVDNSNSFDGKIRVDASKNCDYHPVLSHAVIHVKKVHIHSRDGSWHEFRNDPFDFNLLHPDNLPLGGIARGSCGQNSFDRIRLIPDGDGDVRYRDGRLAHLKFDDSGLEFPLDHDVQMEDGSIAVLNMHFDINRSFGFSDWDRDIRFMPEVAMSCSNHRDHDDWDDRDRDDDRFDRDRDRDQCFTPPPAPSPSPSVSPSPSPSASPSPSPSVSPSPSPSVSPSPSPSVDPSPSPSVSPSPTPSPSPTSFPPLTGACFTDTFANSASNVFALSQTNPDPTTIVVTLNGLVTAGSYDASTNSVTVPTFSRGSGTVIINYCQPSTSSGGTSSSGGSSAPVVGV